MINFTQIPKYDPNWDKTQFENYERLTHKQHFEIDDFIHKKLNLNDFDIQKSEINKDIMKLILPYDLKDSALRVNNYIPFCIDIKSPYKNFHSYIYSLVSFYYTKLKENLENNNVFYQFFYEKDDFKFVRWNQLIKEYHIKKLWDNFEKLVSHVKVITWKMIHLDNPDIYLDYRIKIKYTIPEIIYIYKCVTNNFYQNDVSFEYINGQYKDYNTDEYCKKKMIDLFEKYLFLLFSIEIPDLSNCRRIDSKEISLLFDLLDEVEKIQGLMNAIETYTSISSCYHLETRKDIVKYIIENYSENIEVEKEKNKILLEEYYFNYK